MNTQTRNDHRRIIRSIWIGFGIGIALLVGLKAHGEDTAVIPDAPTPQRATTNETPKQHTVRMFALSSVAGAELGDVLTTEHCRTVPGCHEAILPQALANSPAGMTAFVAGKFLGEFILSNKLARRHPKLALVGDLLSSSLTWSTVGHNIAVQSGGPAKTAERKLGK